jgi:hypothetical protein
MALFRPKRPLAAARLAALGRHGLAELSGNEIALALAVSLDPKNADDAQWEAALAACEHRARDVAAGFVRCVRPAASRFERTTSHFDDRIALQAAVRALSGASAGLRACALERFEASFGSEAWVAHALAELAPNRDAAALRDMSVDEENARGCVGDFFREAIKACACLPPSLPAFAALPRWMGLAVAAARGIANPLGVGDAIGHVLAAAGAAGMLDGADPAQLAETLRGELPADFFDGVSPECAWPLWRAVSGGPECLKARRLLLGARSEPTPGEWIRALGQGKTALFRAQPLLAHDEPPAPLRAGVLRLSSLSPQLRALYEGDAISRAARAGSLLREETVCAAEPAALAARRLALRV